MGKEAQEVCLKTWLSGGRMVLNRNTWYAHWAKDVGLYKDVKEEKHKSAEFALRFWSGNDHGYKHSLSWLIEKFAPVPTWEDKHNEINKEKDAQKEISIDEEKETNTKNPKQVIIKEIQAMNLRNYFIQQKRIRKDILSPIMVRGYQRNPHLFGLFNDMGLKKGVEVGVRGGSNALVICNQIPGLSLALVDPWEHNSHLIRVKRILAPFNIQIIKKKSMDALNDFEDNSLDFIHIDANHKFDFVMEDLIGWAKKVRSGGIISGHDYFNWTGGDVVLAVDTYTRAHKIKDWFITNEPIPSFFWVKK